MSARQLDVSLINKAACITLSGTLTLSPVGTKHPVAILIHGQGPFDRNLNLLGMRPFKTIAEYLAGQGIATLRYDKRGIGKSEGDFHSATVDDFAGDVQAAREWLASREEINPNKIGLIGISEGGIIGPIVAGNSDRIAFCVMLAGPVLPANETLALFFSILANGSLARDRSFAMYRGTVGRLLDLINEGMSTTQAKDEALELATELTPHIVNDNTKILWGGVAQITPEELIGMLSSPCLTAAMIHDPQDYLPKVACPLLALYGAKDVHVPAPEHIEEIRRILRGSKNEDYMIKEIPNANHMFQTCKTGFPIEYTTIDHDISPEVLQLTCSWILERTTGQRKPVKQNAGVYREE